MTQRDMCRRDTKDPLLRMMLDRYQLHLLSVPRADATVGDLYVHDGSAVSAPGNVRHLLTPPLDVVADLRSQRMADISGEATNRFEVSAGLGFLEGVLAALGAPGLVQAMSVGFKRERARSVRFSFSEVTRDSVDVLNVGRQIWRHRVDHRHGFAGHGRRYYLVTATTRTDAVTVVAERADGVAPELDFTALGADVRAGVSINSASRGEVTFHAPEPLVFGVELHELVLEHESGTLRLKTMSQPLVLRGDDSEPAIERATLNTGDASLLLVFR